MNLQTPDSTLATKTVVIPADHQQQSLVGAS